MTEEYECGRSGWDHSARNLLRNKLQLQRASGFFRYASRKGSNTVRSDVVIKYELRGAVDQSVRAGDSEPLAKSVLQTTKTRHSSIVEEEEFCERRERSECGRRFPLPTDCVCGVIESFAAGLNFQSHSMRLLDVA